MNPRRLFPVLLLLLFAAGTAHAQKYTRLTGSGKVATENRQVGNFHGLDVGGAFQIVLHKASKPMVRIEADDNLLAHIRTESQSGILDIGMRSNISIHNSTKLVVHVYYTNLDMIDISGAARLTAEEAVQSDKLLLDLSGAASATLSLEARELTVDASGASKATVSGSAQNVTIDASGAAKLDIQEMAADNLTADLSGAAKVNAQVRNSIRGEISGAASLNYRGRPTVEVERSGAGSVRAQG